MKKFFPLFCHSQIFELINIIYVSDIVWGDKDNIVLMDMQQIVQNKAANTIVDLPMTKYFGTQVAR